MNIDIRAIGGYLSITVETWDTKIDLGLFDEMEAGALMDKLNQASEEIKSWLDK